MRVDQIMTEEVACCRPEDTLARVAEQLWQNDCGCLPVVDAAGGLRAMVTDRDICMAGFTKGRPLHEIRVEECMSPDVASCHADDPVAAAAKTMAEHQVRRLPVVDGAGKVCGVLSVNDLLRSISRGTPPTDALTVLTAVARRPGEPTGASPAPAARQASTASAVLTPTPAPTKKAAPTNAPKGSKAPKPPAAGSSTTRKKRGGGKG